MITPCTLHHVFWEAVPGGLLLYPFGDHPPDEEMDWFEEKILKVVDLMDRPEVHVDFGWLQYVTSIGIGSLLRLFNRTRKREGQVTLYHVSPAILEIFHLCRLDTVPWFMLRESGMPVGKLRLPDPDWQAWNGGTVTGLARTINEGHDFALMPVLGDALEEAGCTVPDILDHCRLQQKHDRNCWLIAMLLTPTRGDAHTRR